MNGAITGPADPALAGLVCHLIDHGIGAQRPLAYHRLTEMLRRGGGLEGMARARLLLAALNNCDEDVGRFCIANIAGLDAWEALLGDAATALSPGNAADVIVRVLRERLPLHPLAALAASPREAVAAYDLHGQGRHLQMPSRPLADGWTQAWLLGVDRPARDWATIRHIEVSARHIALEIVDERDWLEPARTACPPALLVVY